MFKKIGSLSKSQVVRNEIVNLILKGELKKEDKLPVEHELAEKFNVSRMTIREAMKELRLMGVVEIKQGEGTFISSVAPEFYMSPLLPILLFTEKNIDDLYDARAYIEMGTAGFAAINRTEEQLIQLEQIYQTMVEKMSSDNTKEYTNAIASFHHYIAEICNNEFLLQIYNTMNHILNVCIERSAITQASREITEADHLKILECIRNQDSKAAEEAVREHILKTKEIFKCSQD